MDETTGCARTLGPIEPLFKGLGRGLFEGQRKNMIVELSRSNVVKLSRGSKTQDKPRIGLSTMTNRGSDY